MLRKMLFGPCLLLVCSVLQIWAQKTCDSSDGNGCCDCSTPYVGDCIQKKGTNTNRKCTCYSLIFYCTSDGYCAKDKCAQSTVRNTPTTLATIPWTTSPGIVGQLAANSTLPNPGILYEVIIDDELRTGPVGHHGVVGDPTKKSSYAEWFNMEDNPDTHRSQLTIWLDTEGVWTKGSDVHMSPARLPIAETVSFSEDHWEQTTTKGTFSGKVEPFPSPGQARVGKLPFRTTPDILAHIPWTTSPWIATQLAENSTLPNPGLLYDVIVNAELKTGPVGHSGVMGDPTQKSKYNIWWDLNDNADTHQSRLRIWLDEEGLMQSIQDVELNSAKLPTAETANFYQDHWEQTTAKGTFSGKVEPFPSPAQARVNPLSNRAKSNIISAKERETEDIAKPLGSR